MTKTLLQRTKFNDAVAIKARALGSLLLLSGACAGSALAGDIHGTTKGNGAVNQLGGYNYTVPLQVAPGIMGLQPSLSLVYSTHGSRAGSILGTGWALGGLSSIHRCGKTIAQDGNRGGINFDNTDRLCKDGVRLVSSKGNGDNDYWSNASDQYYHSIDEDWSKITASYSGTAISNLTLTTKDRQTLRYGYYNNSSNLNPNDGDGPDYGRYLLNQVTDRNGNVLTYHYTKENETSRISSITYNNRKVEFDYSISSTHNQQNGYSTALNPWESSDEFLYGHRLNTIKMSVSGEIYKVYRIGYESSNTTGRYRLSKVEECTAVTGGDCVYPALSFAYNDYDWAGDFKKVTVNQSSHQKYLRGGHNGFNAMPVKDSTHVADGGANIIPGDWNGDGLSDFIRQEVSAAEPSNGDPGGESVGTPWTNDNSQSFGFYLSDGDGSFSIHYPTDFNEQAVNKGYHATASGGSGFSGVEIIPGDFNGDGKLDYIRQEYGAIAEDYASTFRIYFNNGNDSNGNPTFYMREPVANQTIMAGSHTTGCGEYKGADLHVGDFNGDGKSDLLRVEKGTWANDNIGSFQVFLANNNTDVNGDFTRFDPNAHGEQSDIKLQENGDGATLIVGDYNGDGKDDFIRQEVGGWAQSDSANTFRVYFSNGDGGFTMRQPTANSIQSRLKGGHGTDSNGRTLYTGDFNGDGKTDFISQTHGQWATNATDNLAVWFSRGDGEFDYHYDSNAVLQNDLRGQTVITAADDERWGSKPSMGIGTNLITGDFNGDGRTDFIRQEAGDWVNNNDNTFRVYISRGDGNWDIKSPADPAFNAALKGLTTIQCNYNVNCALSSDDWFKWGVDIIPADFDGDGKLDFIARQFGLAKNNAVDDFAVYFNPLRDEQPVDSLKTVTAGFAQWNISYDYLTHIPVTLVGPGPTIDAGFMQVTGPAALVSEINISAVNTSNIEDQQIKYTYGKAIAGNKSSFLGFTQTQETFVQRGKKVISDYTAMEHNGVYSSVAHNINTLVYPGAFQIIANVLHQYEQVSGSHGSTVTRKKQTTNSQYLNGATISQTESYDYDAYSNVVRTVRTDGNKVTASGYRYDHDTTGNNWQIAQLDGKWLCDGAGSVTNGLFACDEADMLSVTGFSYNGVGDVTEQRKYFQVVPSHGKLTTSYDYDSYGNRTKITDPNGMVTDFAYEPTYNTYPQSKTTDATGKNLVESYQYDAKFGGMTQLTDHNGVVSKTNYDSAGRLESIEKENPSGVLTTVETQSYRWVWEYGNLVQDGNTLRLQRKVYTDWALSSWYYDTTFANIMGQKVLHLREDGTNRLTHYNAWKYDANGRKTKELIPTIGISDWQFTLFEYDVTGRLNKVDMPTGEDTLYNYAANSADCNAVRSNLIKVSITQGTRERSRCVNVAETDEKVNFVTDNTSVTHLSSRDRMGRLTQLTNGSTQNTTSFEYDVLNRQTKVINAQRGTESYLFSPTTGFMTDWTHTGTDGTTVIGAASIEYDLLGRKKAQIYSDGKRVDYAYDSAILDNNAGRLSSTTVTQNGAQTLYKEFAYDRQGNIKAKSITIAGKTHLFAYNHSPTGKVAQMSYPSGRVIDYGYDGYDQIDTIKEGATVLADYGEYTATNRYIDVAFNNGVTENRVYDSNARLDTVVIDKSGADLLNQTYAYTSFSEVDSITDNMGSNDLSYGYSATGYVNQATGPWGTENYSYDDNGDISFKNGNDYQYDGQGYLTSAGANLYNYNKAGSLKQKEEAGKHYEYQYNAKQELTSVTTSASSANYNVALGKTATQSSTYTAQSGAEKAIDGNTNGDLAGDSVTLTQLQSNPWWQVDLGESHTVDQVILYNRTDCCDNRLNNFDVDYLDQNDNVIASDNYAGTAGATVTIDLIASNVYKVRVQLNQLNSLNLAEVQVIGQPTNSAVATAMTTFNYDGNGSRLSKIAPDGSKVIYVDGGFEIQDNGSQVLITDYVMGAEGRIASFTAEDTTNAFAAVAGSSSSFFTGSYLQHDMMASMMNTETLGGSIGWAQHSLASYINHPNAANVFYMLVVLPLLFSLVMFMVHYIRSANPVSSLGRMYNAVVNAIGKAGWINPGTLQRLQVRTGTQFMQEHRVLSLGAPAALVGMMLMFGPIGLVGTAQAAGNPQLGANATQYFHHDRLNSTILVTNGSGIEVSKPVYKPFGEVYNNTDDDSYRYGFAGKEADDTGLMYFGSRYYDPALGRFITADSAGIGSEGYGTAQLNRYAFSQNDPVNMADPSGNLVFATMSLIIFVVSATVSTAAQLIIAKVRNCRVDWAAIGIGIAVSAIMAPIGAGLGMGVAKLASTLATTRLGAASMYISMSLMNAGIAPSLVTGAATAASAVTKTAIASALYSGISQGFGKAFDSSAKWSWRAFAMDIAFDVVFLSASYVWNNKMTSANKYMADMESNSAMRAQARENGNFKAGGKAANRDIALEAIKKNEFKRFNLDDASANVWAKRSLSRELKKNHGTTINGASSDQLARAVEAFTPTYRFTSEFSYQFGDGLFWSIKNETKRQLNEL